MYCGACARDITLVRALLHFGHDVEIIPLYTPLKIEKQDELPITPVQYGAVNAYLQQLSELFQHIPAFIAQALDSPAFLTWVGQFAVSTRASEVGAMAVSILAGRDGKQRKELDKLLDYLGKGDHPDLVSITNTMLSGIAPAVKERLQVPVLCALQGEDSFMDAMGTPYAEQANALVRRNAQQIDLFVTFSFSYADRMAKYLDVPRAKIRVVRPGVDTADYPVVQQRLRVPFTIGYLSVITRMKGLDILVEATRILLADGRDIFLKFAGKVLDAKYFAEISDAIDNAGMAGRVTISEEVEMGKKQAFLQSCSVFSVPSRIQESRGMAILEAMSTGIPVIVPETGIYPEMINMTQGGITVPPDDPVKLAAAIVRLMDDPDEADAMGKRARAGVEQYFEATQTARDMEEIYLGMLTSKT